MFEGEDNPVPVLSPKVTANKAAPLRFPQQRDGLRPDLVPRELPEEALRLQGVANADPFVVGIRISL